ncbi:MAG: hypothetical protein QM627_07225 [Luteolibacter sp.]
MKSLPAHDPEDYASVSGKMPSLPTPLGVGQAPPRNHRRIPSGNDRIYPVLLAISTLLSGVFCYLYLTKPVRVVQHTVPQPAIVPAVPETKPATPEPTAEPSVSPPEEKLLPSLASTPIPRGDTSPFEETNLRVQHILTAESPNGEINKIILNIPVLYQSRNLRWTTTDIIEARVLLNKLNDYQERSAQLRAEGSVLLTAWNRLVERTIPGGQIRADSPSLPASQQAATAPIPQDANVPQSIQLQPSEK